MDKMDVAISNIDLSTIETTSDFLGFGKRGKRPIKNATKRLGKLFKKAGAKAKKVQDKLLARVDKLAAIGKVDKKRFLFLTDKINKSGENSLTNAEHQELAKIQVEVEKAEPTLVKEINDENETADDLVQVENPNVVIPIPDVATTEKTTEVPATETKKYFTTKNVLIGAAFIIVSCYILWNSMKNGSIKK